MAVSLSHSTYNSVSDIYTFIKPNHQSFGLHLPSLTICETNLWCLALWLPDHYQPEQVIWRKALDVSPIHQFDTIINRVNSYLEALHHE